MHAVLACAFDRQLGGILTQGPCPVLLAQILVLSQVLQWLHPNVAEGAHQLSSLPLDLP